LLDGALQPGIAFAIAAKLIAHDALSRAIDLRPGYAKHTITARLLAEKRDFPMPSIIMKQR